MSLDWAVAEGISSAADGADEVLKEMIARVVDFVPKLSDDARTRLALHMAGAYKGSSPVRTFCAVPSFVFEDNEFSKTLDGAEYMRLRPVEDAKVDPLEPAGVESIS